MSSDASARGWRSQEKKKSHINVSELKSSQIGKNDFYSNKKNGISIHVRADKIAVLSYLMKIEHTKKQ